MKLAIVTILACVAAISAAPTKISDNNVGDVVNVGVKAKMDIDSSIYALLASLTAKASNDQQIKIKLPYQDYEPYGAAPSSMISPDMIQNFVQMMSNKGE